MRLPGRPGDAAILSAFLLPFLTNASNFVCSNIVQDGAEFDFSKLGGARSVITSVDKGASIRNTTYTIDICKPLGKAKGVDPKIQCPNGTRVCAIERVIIGDSDNIEEVIPIAGELKGKIPGGSDLDAKWERLKTSKSSADSEKEGARVVMNGGIKKADDGSKRKQKAIVEFICDKSRTGLEYLPNPEDPYEENMDKRDEAADDTTPSLTFLKYEPQGDIDVLRLEWRTKEACEDAKNEQNANKGQRWGLFTWFIIVAFLSIAAYLIFGSWLNYNRYGARGWDLLPHGDTIRDVPYLLKDWVRRVLNTVQGSGSRGGYAAV